LPAFTGHFQQKRHAIGPANPLYPVTTSGYPDGMTTATRHILALRRRPSV